MQKEESSERGERDARQSRKGSGSDLGRVANEGDLAVRTKSFALRIIRLFETRSSPESLGATLAPLPSISEIPFPRFLLSLLAFPLFYFRSTLRCESLAHRNHPGRTGGFSIKTRRAFLSRAAEYRLDLQKTRRLLRRDD